MKLGWTRISPLEPFYMQLLQLHVAHHCYIGHLRYQGHLRGKLKPLVYEMGGPLELDQYQNVEGENVTESREWHSEAYRAMQMHIMQCWSETDGWRDGKI